jgi:hypothetical protein
MRLAVNSLISTEELVSRRRSFRPPLILPPEGNKVIHIPESVCNASGHGWGHAECTMDFDEVVGEIAPKSGCEGTRQRLESWCGDSSSLAEGFRKRGGHTEKILTCTHCTKTFKVSGPFSRAEEIKQSVPCPHCNETNGVMWPMDSGITTIPKSRPTT